MDLCKCPVKTALCLKAGVNPYLGQGEICILHKINSMVNAEQIQILWQWHMKVFGKKMRHIVMIQIEL